MEHWGLEFVVFDACWVVAYYNQHAVVWYKESSGTRRTMIGLPVFFACILVSYG